MVPHHPELKVTALIATCLRHCTLLVEAPFEAIVAAMLGLCFRVLATEIPKADRRFTHRAKLGVFWHYGFAEKATRKLKLERITFV